MKKIKLFHLLTLAAGLLAFGWPFTVDAASANPNPCSEDLAKFCAKIPPGPPGPASWIAQMNCLEEHEKELSQACREFEAGMGGARVERSEGIRERRKFRQSCMGDMMKFCGETGPAQGSMMKCLTEHQSELSAPCSQSIKALTR
jgi:hypothetical protein